MDGLPDAEAFWRRCQAPDVLLIGTNRVLAVRAVRSVCWDVLVIRDTYRNLWADPDIGWRYHEELWKPYQCWKVGPADRRSAWCDEYVRQVPGWQPVRTEDRDGEAAVMLNNSVVLMAANWAYWRGVRDFYLVGVDYGGRHASMIPPYGQECTGNEWRYQRPVPQCIERQFAEMRRAVEPLGCVVNLSPTSRLAAIEKRDWRQTPLRQSRNPVIGTR